MKGDNKFDEIVENQQTAEQKTAGVEEEVVPVDDYEDDEIALMIYKEDEAWLADKEWVWPIVREVTKKKRKKEKFWNLFDSILSQSMTEADHTFDWRTVYMWLRVRMELDHKRALNKVLDLMEASKKNVDRELAKVAKEFIRINPRSLTVIAKEIGLYTDNKSLDEFRTNSTPWERVDYCIFEKLIISVFNLDKINLNDNLDIQVGQERNVRHVIKNLVKNNDDRKKALNKKSLGIKELKIIRDGYLTYVIEGDYWNTNFKELLKSARKDLKKTTGNEICLKRYYCLAFLVLKEKWVKLTQKQYIQDLTGLYSMKRAFMDDNTMKDCMDELKYNKDVYARAFDVMKKFLAEKKLI